jgi:hypothetical protein
VRLLRAEPGWRLLVLGSTIGLGFWGVLLGAAVIEETRPPPVVVVSWAPTREAAARIMTCENFMLKDVVIELID